MPNIFSYIFERLLLNGGDQNVEYTLLSALLTKGKYGN